MLQITGKKATKSVSMFYIYIISIHTYILIGTRSNGYTARC